MVPRCTIFVMALNLRNCCRCGREFRTDKRDLICSDCRKKDDDDDKEPSFREWQVIDMIGKALPNKEIAYQLHLSEGTVKEYLNRVFRKMNMTSRTELAVWAVLNHVRVLAWITPKTKTPPKTGTNS